MKNMAVAYQLMKKKERVKKMSEGGETLGTAIGYPGSPSPKKPSASEMMAEGGDIVDRVMAKRYSEGGKVSNESHELSESRPNEFDDLVLRDGLSSDYGVDDNSGDALGDAEEDADRSDIVERVMRSRAKKDRMPRPA